MQSKKIPRVLLTGSEALGETLKGLYVMWPDKSQSEIFELSLAGMSLYAPEQVGRVRMDESIHFELRIEGQDETIPLEARVLQIRSQSLGFLFESISSQGRLVIEQATKDSLVAQNLGPFRGQGLPSDVQPQVWFHGPFDSNILLWQNQAGVLQKAWVEYDNLVWIYEGEETLLQKSSSAVDPAQKYFSSQMTFSVQNPKSAKVSMGASWLDRLIKVVDQARTRHEGLFELFILLRKSRGH